MDRDQKQDATLMKSYFDFKKRLQTNNHFNYTIDYWSIYQTASTSLEGQKRDAFSGVLRGYGSWDLAGRKSGNTGSLIFKVENRHQYGDFPAAQDLGFNVGYAGLTATPFSAIGWALTNFYWQQSFLKGKLAFVAGIVDPTDYTNVYGLVDPWNDFYNLAFSTGAHIPVPNQGMGVAIRGSVTDNIYVLAGVSDTNGDPTDPLGSFESFFGTAEYFSLLEVGWVKSYSERFSDNIHVTAWHAAERKEVMVPSGWGMAFSFARFLGGHWEPFFRTGFAQDGGALWQSSVDLGCGYRFTETQNQLSLGVSWGRPSESTLGEGLNDQYTIETYYRIHLGKLISITPDLQLLINPALNPNKDFLTVFGLRARAAI